MKLKTLSLILAALLTLFLLASCGKAQSGELSTDVPDAGKTETETETDIETEKAASVFDFSTVDVSEYDGVVMSVGETLPADLGKADAKICSSNEEVVKLDGSGDFSAVGEGVALVAYDFPDDIADDEHKDTCFAVCVLPKGQHRDPTAVSTYTYESGTQTKIPSEMLNCEVTSDNEDVVRVDKNALVFGNSGYAVVTVSSASVPHVYSYIVYER